MDIVIYKRGEEWIVGGEHTFEPFVGMYKNGDRVVLHVGSYTPSQPSIVTTSNTTD